MVKHPFGHNRIYIIFVVFYQEDREGIVYLAMVVEVLLCTCQRQKVFIVEWWEYCYLFHGVLC